MLAAQGKNPFFIIKYFFPLSDKVNGISHKKPSGSRIAEAEGSESIS
jgi:hypothetical protein